MRTILAKLEGWTNPGTLLLCSRERTNTARADSLSENTNFRRREAGSGSPRDDDVSRMTSGPPATDFLRFWAKLRAEYVRNLAII